MKDLLFYTYLNVREDGIFLYGFTSEEELNMFKLLLLVSKIGPKVATGLLSFLTPNQIKKAIINKDVGILSKAPGIGKKTAERIILELKDKIDNNEKAYFLGFMYADGTCRKNSENSAQCSLKINSNDEYILKKYADIIYDKDEYPIRRYPNGENRVETSVLTFYGVEFFKNLEKLGCTENKTFTLKFPNENQVPK